MAVSAQNQRRISSPPAAGFIAMCPSKYRGPTAGRRAGGAPRW